MNQSLSSAFFENIVQKSEAIPGVALNGEPAYKSITCATNYLVALKNDSVKAYGND
jgi:hypothetical protein